MFNSDKKKNALKKLEAIQRQYELAGIRTNDAVQSLYNAKKEAVNVIEESVEILKKLTDFGIDNLRKIADAKNSIRLFQEAILNERIAFDNTYKSINDSCGEYAKLAETGAAVGEVVSKFGPTAAMAFATTFGTTATGTAISSLTGAAATNAALAWLGGGALAAGGGGMVAGSAILAMFGPIGWAFGGIISAAGFLKNKKIANQADELTERVQKTLSELDNLNSDIDKTLKRITEETSNLNLLMKSNPSIDDYNSIVETIDSLCSLINKKFIIKKSENDKH